MSSNVLGLLDFYSSHMEDENMINSYVHLIYNVWVDFGHPGHSKYSYPDCIIGIPENTVVDELAPLKSDQRYY